MTSDTLIPVRLDGQFRIKELLGTGSFANVYQTINIITNQSYAIKLELAMEGGSSVEREYYALKELVDIAGLPRLRWFGRESNFDALVINLLGPSLYQLLQQHQKFCVSTVAYLANQLVSHIEQIHSHGYVHGDIKPQNILMGLGDQCRTIFIVDFGLAQKYRHPTTRNHIPFRQVQCIRGTPAFSLIHSHLGSELGWRDDL
ncbi:hypothetical protein SCLCIDRAFT_23697 [Scleroderma citrinum Foug A]|uniref:non-specific serine/threonine protein kinase n=1 Tax=Scleroderma citrinum Foug A TaxID=1036808 RepID=A0A0C3AGN2_9AGAM|nr:hypothetical protein SCLCIDRAFT_23697 [Scleroderma citrinum Foug A]